MVNRDFLSAVFMGGSRTLPSQVGVLKWEPSCIKTSSDGAFNSSRGLAAFSVIARDSGGSA